MEYRIDKDTLLDTLSVWNSHLKRKVHLIACGGTALTLLNVKESTKDIEKLKEKFYETSSYDVSDEKNRKNFAHFLNRLHKEGFKDG